MVRKLSLKHRHDVVVDVSDLLRNKIGTAVHEIFEKDPPSHYIVEKRHSMKINGSTLSGKTDAYDTKLKTLLDWKTVTEGGVVSKNNLNKKIEGWEKQLNIYAHLWRSRGYEVDYLKIYPIILDWSKMKTLYNPNYPKCQMIEIDIKLWSVEKVEKFIHKQINMHKKSINMDISNIIPCSYKERWSSKTYAVQKKGAKRATRVFDKKKDATLFIKQKELKDTQIILREGIDIRCLNYCNFNKFCPYYIKTYVKEYTYGQCRNK